MRALRRGSSRGYTAVEVLLSMTVFAIGAAGVIAMQRGAVQGNLDARRLDVANSIARAWTERLRRDAMHWTTGTNLAQATILQDAITRGAASTSGWVLPIGCSTAAPDGTCAAFDMFGHDVSDYKTAIFCANIRVDVVATTTGAPLGTADATVLRAMVRVYWPKGIGIKAAHSSATEGFCSAGALTDTNAGPDAANAAQIYHFVQDSTLVSNSVIPQ